MVRRALKWAGIGLALAVVLGALAVRYLPGWYNTWTFHRLLADWPAVPEHPSEAALEEVTRFIHSHERCAVIFSTASCGPCRLLEQNLAQLDERQLIPQYHFDVPGTWVYEQLRAAGIAYPATLAVPTLSVFEHGRLVRTYTGWGSIGGADGFMESAGLPERVSRILAD